METTVRTYYLEMTDPTQLRPSRHDGSGVEIVRARIPCPEFNRFFYTAVGGDWYWVDRLSWTYERWRAWVDRPELETWVLYEAGTPGGYFELEAQAEGQVEIAYFGLLPHCIGRGLGGYMLTRALRRAWAMAGTQRVWVHTCSLDHPGALAAYRARGLRVYQEETSVETLPERTPGPWPGANRTGAASTSGEIGAR